MRQKGFATIFGLCLILVIALIVRGIHDAEANHAREVTNFETEQALQLAAESGIVEAAEKVRNGTIILPYSTAQTSDKIKIPVNSPDNITVEVWGERGKIYVYPDGKTEIKAIHFKSLYPSYDGVYLMSRATINKGFFGEKIYRRAYAYIVDDDATIHFMELPTQNGNIVKKT